jgi:acyl-CoA thioesterase I
MRNLISVFAIMVLIAFGCQQADTAEGIETEQHIQTEQKTEDKEETAERKKTIVFFGNSLTAGYGLEPSEAFPALIQQRIDSLGLPFRVVNAGVSGETSSGGKGRIDWLLKQPVDIFVLELGANDGLRGINPTETYQNLAAIIDRVREKNPDVEIILAGMEMPPSMGQRYTKEFKNVFSRLASDKDAILIPFILKGVAGEKELNQNDGIHPTVKGQKILANNVWEVLEPVIK